LADLGRPRARLRCSACGEIHLLTRETGGAVAAGELPPLPPDALLKIPGR